jgi:hypothetical protein
MHDLAIAQIPPATSRVQQMCLIVDRTYVQLRSAEILSAVFASKAYRKRITG